MSLKAKIEAVLYLTDKPLRAQAIAGIVGEDLQVVRTALLDLIHEYEERQGGLEIADEEGYSFQVKDQYSNLMDEFLPIEMSAAQLRTLSAIAIKQPIAQSEIIRIRGAGAYDHIRELVLRGLVTKREDEKARSPMLSTTKQFQEYFRLTKDGKSLRSYLKREMKKKDKQEEDLLVTSAELLSGTEGLPSTEVLAGTESIPSTELLPAGTPQELPNVLSFSPDESAQSESGLLPAEESALGTALESALGAEVISELVNSHIELEALALEIASSNTGSDAIAMEPTPSQAESDSVAIESSASGLKSETNQNVYMSPEADSSVPALPSVTSESTDRTSTDHN